VIHTLVKVFELRRIKGQRFWIERNHKKRRNREANRDQHQLSILIGVVAIVALVAIVTVCPGTLNDALD
jgi:hypothetical protein